MAGSITVYGATWCGDCLRSKKFLDDRGIAYNWVDTDHDDAARDYVRSLQNGGHSIPTIVFEDGSFLVEPTNAELGQKIGVRA